VLKNKKPELDSSGFFCREEELSFELFINNPVKFNQFEFAFRKH